MQSNGKRCYLGASKWSAGRGHGSSLRLGLSEPQMQYIMPRSLGGFRNCQADDSQPEHARGCVRPRRHGSYRLPSRHGPWTVMMLFVVTDGHLQLRALMQCQAQIEAPSLLAGSLGIHKITVASSTASCWEAAGVLRVPIGRPFSRQPAIVE